MKMAIGDLLLMVVIVRNSFEDEDNHLATCSNALLTLSSRQAFGSYKLGVKIAEVQRSLMEV